MTNRHEEKADESIGDLGDLFALFGFRAEARELYHIAQEIDPTDSEWWESIRALDLNR